MSEAGDARAVSGWLRRFKWSLGSVPSPEREDIVAEVRAHLSERLAGGIGVTDALNAFGTPETYARSFVEEMELARALTGGRIPSMLGVIVRLAHRSAVAAAAFVVVLLVAGLAAGITLTAILKIFDPTQVGFWVGPGGAHFGPSGGGPEMRELLGGWIYLLAPVSVAAAWVLCRLVLIRALRTIRQSRG